MPSKPTAANDEKLGVGSGIGLCVASMVGSGIFLSSGYMAQTMSAGAILLAWGLGGVLALLGVATYAELARQLPRSGGEYRYLREFGHPALGYVAGWVTFVIGFAQPTAINALAATAFLSTLMPVPHTRLVAAGAIVLIALGHAFDRSSSRWLQDALVVAKTLLLAGFVILGLFAGNNHWPAWQPPSGSTSIAAVAASLFYISYAFSGWNTCAYAAESFKRPDRDVGRAMLIACLGVGALYLAINWIFVANLDPAAAAVVMDSEQATLGHAVTQKLAGHAGARFMSALAVMSFLSAMSAMLMVGPHIAATMANDGALPGIFAPRSGKPPALAIAFQAAVAVLVLSLHTLSEALAAVGATLMLFSALCALALLLAHFRGQLPTPARPTSLAASGLYALFSVYLLYLGFRDDLHLVPWLGAVIACALVAYVGTHRQRRRH